MNWRQLCFMHWPVAAAPLHACLPPGLTLDTFNGQAYLGVVPFLMSDVAPRGLPSVSGLSAFPELNLRTYVLGPDKQPGVWFFSLDASQKVAVRLARAGFHLPYYDAQMWHRQRGSVTEYASRRTHRSAVPGEFAAAYAPSGPVFCSPPGTLEAWLTERYCLYSASGKQLYRGRIEHQPWPLQRARAEIKMNTLGDLIGVELRGEPHLLYGETLEVRARAIERL